MRPGASVPYTKCIDQINKLDGRAGVLTPLERMNCIAEISSCIKDAVQDFWTGVEVDQRKLTLDAE